MLYSINNINNVYDIWEFYLHRVFYCSGFLFSCGTLVADLVSPEPQFQMNRPARMIPKPHVRVWQMMAANTGKESKTNREVVLGFLEEAESWQLLSNQFPSKVGGRPAWLSQVDLPAVSELQCEKCKRPTVFLLQVYAPITEYDRCFHRTLFVFCCKTPACYTRNDNKCFKGNLYVIIFWTEPTNVFIHWYLNHVFTFI